MASPLQFAFRTQKHIGITDAAPVYEPLAGFTKPEGNLRCCEYSPCGRYFAWATPELVTVIKADDGQHVLSLPIVNVYELGFSPLGTFLVTWERPGKDENGDATKNLKVWRTVEDGVQAAEKQPLGKYVQKSQGGWNLQYTADEKFCARQVTNEVQFYESHDLGTVWNKLRVEGVSDFALSPGNAHAVAVFVSERKGQPASVKVFNVPQFNSPISQKTFFKGDKVQLKWNKQGTSILVLAQTDVDKSNKSYYGETTLYLLSVNGSFDARVNLDKEGPIHDVTWSPNSKEFGVVYGYMPAKTTIFNQRAVATHSFALGTLAPATVYEMATPPARVDLDGKPIKPLTICMIGAGGFIGSHLCDKIMAETPHKVLALDVYNDKIKHLLEPATTQWTDRIQFHRLNIKNDSRLEGLIKMSDLTINLAAICTPADYNTRPLDTIYSNFIDALPVVKYCSENNKRLIHFSTCEVYGKTIGSYLPKDSPLRQDPAYYILKEDTSPCIFGSIEKQRWSYACAKQLIERLVYAEGAENGLEFTIVRPFNWIGPRMDFIPGIDGPSEGVPRVLACFSNGLLRGEPLKLVDGGESQRTFVYIKDAIEAVLLMIENPARANGHIFNVGNPHNEVTVRELAEMMTQVYAKVSGEPTLEKPTIDVSSKEFYGEGYDDSDKRIPDMTIINKQLGWNPKTSLWDLLESTLTYQHRTYAEAIKKSMSKPATS